VHWEREATEPKKPNLASTLAPHAWVRRLLVPAAILALVMTAGAEFSSLGVCVAQTPAAAEPAQGPPRVSSDPETMPTEQPAAAGTGKNTPQSGLAADAAAQSAGSQVAGDCAALLKLATDLKAEVDKTTKDELSVTVVRKAGEIEQLARKVRDANRIQAGKN
jgi:hypothetical protein